MDRILEYMELYGVTIQSRTYFDTARLNGIGDVVDRAKMFLGNLKEYEQKVPKSIRDSEPLENFRGDMNRAVDAIARLDL